jgi:hypothetical protein
MLETDGELSTRTTRAIKRTRTGSVRVTWGGKRHGHFNAGALGRGRSR